MGKEQSFNITNMRNFFAKENMEKLFADCPTITLKKNECIYATEQILTDVFWVSQGMVEVFITNEQGHKQVVAFHYPDSIVGEIEALYGQHQSADRPERLHSKYGWHHAEYHLYHE